MKKPFVIVESPYAGNIVRNVRYARAAIRDCLLRGEVPFASHLLYTQEGVLDDNVGNERALGIEAGLEVSKRADKTVVYTDLGFSGGMKMGIGAANSCVPMRPVEYRSLHEWRTSFPADYCACTEEYNGGMTGAPSNIVHNPLCPYRTETR